MDTVFTVSVWIQGQIDHADRVASAREFTRLCFHSCLTYVNVQFTDALDAARADIPAVGS